MPVLLHIKKHWVTFITSPDYLRPNQIGQRKNVPGSHYEARKHERYAFVPSTSVTWRRGKQIYDTLHTRKLLLHKQTVCGKFPISSGRCLHHFSKKLTQTLFV